MPERDIAIDQGERELDPEAPPRLASSRNGVTRWLGYLGLSVVAFVLYWVSDLLFQRYITIGWSWVLVAATSTIALIAWIVDAVRSDRSGDDV